MALRLSARDIIKVLAALVPRATSPAEANANDVAELH